MPPTPSPPPIEVFVHSGTAEWWQIVAAFGPIAVILGAVAAAFIGWRTLKQKAIADDRAEWWKRTQWALDRALDEDQNTKALGLATLEVLAHSELARNEELELLDIAWKSVNGAADSGSDLPEVVDSADDMGENGTTADDAGEGRS